MTLGIHNVYNEPGTVKGIDQLKAALQQLRGTHPEAEHVMIGDFNLHGPRWAVGDQRMSFSNNLEQLHDLLGEQDLRLLIEKSTVTSDDMRGSQATLDLSFGTQLIESSLLGCIVHAPGEGLEKGSDHFPMETCLDFTWKPAEPIKRRDTAKSKTGTRTPSADLLDGRRRKRSGIGTMGKRLGHSSARQTPLQGSAYAHKEDPLEV